MVEMASALDDLEVSDDDVHPGDDGDDYGDFKHPKVIGSIEDELGLLDKQELIFIRDLCRNLIKNITKKRAPLCPMCKTVRLYKSRLDIGVCVKCFNKDVASNKD